MADRSLTAESNGGAGFTENAPDLYEAKIDFSNTPSATLTRLLGFDASGDVGYTAGTGSNPFSYELEFDNADLVAGVLSVTHNLNASPLHCTIMNNSNKIIYPDDVTFANVNSATIDLSSYGTLTGTWKVRLSK